MRPPLSHDSPPLLLDAAYRRHRPLLLAALAALARRGYAAQPADGLALVHDFFVEAWPGLVERFDERKGRLTTYLYGAFLRFARPRIVREQRWQQGLLPPQKIVGPPDDSDGSAASTVAARLDGEVVRRAFRVLPAHEREVLHARVARGQSEREAARSLGLSRHALRERCAEALAHLAATMDERGAIAGEDWPLARALWSDGLTVDEAAASLGLTEHRARAGRQRILDVLSSSVLEVGPSRPSRVAKNRSQMRNEAVELCRVWQELCVGSDGAATRARAQGEALLEHVEECERCGALEVEDAQQAEAIFLALGVPDSTDGDAELDEADRATVERLLAADAHDEAQVERAVEDALLPSLSARAQKMVSAMPSDVRARSLYLATEAIALLLRRAARATGQLDQRFALDGEGAIVCTGKEVVPPETVRREIARVAHVSDESARQLAAWLPVAALAQPRLFGGLTVEAAGRDRVHLQLATAAQSDDLFERWRPIARRRAARASSLPNSLPNQVAARHGVGKVAAARTRKLRPARRAVVDAKQTETPKPSRTKTRK